MDKELKAKWIRALRSGKYKQARGILKSRNGAMCCIGVLAHIQGVDWENKIPEGERNTCYLPRGFAAGLRKAKLRDLAIKNDGDGAEGKPQSFREIADYIEANL